MSPPIVTELPGTIALNVTVVDSLVGCPPSTFVAVGETGGVVEIARSLTLPAVVAVKTILLPEVTAAVDQPVKVPLYEPFATPGPVVAPAFIEAKAAATCAAVKSALAVNLRPAMVNEAPELSPLNDNVLNS